MTQRTRKAYDAWASNYDTDINPHILLEHDDVLKLVNAKRGDKILDAACGTGKYTIEFFKKKADVIGCDFSKDMIKIAKKKNQNIKYVIADLSKRLPFSNNYFEKVNCAQALKHIKNLKPTFKEFYRILKKNGELIFSVTHPEMDWTGYKIKNRPKFVLSEESDIFHHKFKDYLEAFDFAGFNIEKIMQVPVNKKIKHILTSKSYNKVRGKYQIIIFKLIK